MACPVCWIPSFVLIELCGHVQGVGKLEGETQQVRSLLASNTALLAALKEVAYPQQDPPGDLQGGEASPRSDPAASWRDSAAGLHSRYAHRERWCPHCRSVFCQMLACHPCPACSSVSASGNEGPLCSQLCQVAW